MTQDIQKTPQADPAEENAFFPSAYSLSQFIRPVSELSGADYPKRYIGSQKILVIAADERYLPTDTGALFSTGNHPVETFLPLYHLRTAGFDFDVATLSGQMAKFEDWAMHVRVNVLCLSFGRHCRNSGALKSFLMLSAG